MLKVNGNGLADACDIEFGESEDCNGNGIPDECDISSGNSPDVDGDSFPDECQPTEALFHRGDVNNDSLLDISDAVGILDYLFSGGLRITCLEAADFNNDWLVDITDPVAALNYLFVGGDPPAAPGPVESSCGPDPDAGRPNGDLGCEEYLGCS